jgi:hypothetical protein
VPGRKDESGEWLLRVVAYERPRWLEKFTRLGRAASLIEKETLIWPQTHTEKHRHNKSSFIVYRLK